MLGLYMAPLSQRPWFLSFFLLLFATIPPAYAQTGTSPDAPPARLDTFNGAAAMTSTVFGYESRSGTSLFVKVLSENGKNRLDRQALVKLNNHTLQTVSWQTTSSEESQAAFGDLPFGHYEIDVSALGYLPSHKEFQVVSILVPIHLEVTLQKDPTAVNLSLEEGGLPKNARKNAKHGMAALKSGKWNEADKSLEEAYKVAPDNADLNFLLGYVFYEKKEYGRATDFLEPATTLGPHNVQALTLLGRVALQQADYSRAVSNLEKAITADSDYWVAHDLLAASYLKQRMYDKARDQAQIAIAKGKSNATASQLVLGQALINLGQKEEGIQTLKQFVQTSPKNPSVPQVKDLIARLEFPDSTSSGSIETVLPVSTKIEDVDPMIAAAEPTFSLRPWQPAGIDTNKPSVATGVTCPVENVIQQSGARVEEFVNDVSRIAAIEHLLHEQLDEVGDPITKETRTFNYVASVSESTPGLIAVDEYLQEHLGVKDFPDQIASSGFATLALVFHPAMRDNFEMVCEGLGEWKGQSAWLVHFKQRDDHPARMHDYKVGSRIYALKLKGRAWITSDKFQIVRIESELVSPVPQIRLAGEHQVVEYGPVLFTKKNLQLWLPKSAEIYLDFRRHRYYRKHSFDHYMLFSVDADEKRKKPKAPADAKPVAN